MQIKIFTIPALGGEVLSEEMNAFLRSIRIGPDNCDNPLGCRLLVPQSVA